MSVKQSKAKLTKMQTIRSQNANEWFDSHVVLKTNVDSIFGMSKINVEWIYLLPDYLASRPLTDEGILIVFNSILQNGVSKPKIYLLMWEEDVLKSNLKWNPNTRTLTFPVACKKLLVRPTVVKFFAIVGNHTTHGFLKHLVRKPNSLAYKFVDVKYIICKNTQKNRALAVDLGRFDNIISDARKKIDVWDTLWSLHQSYAKIYSANLDERQTKAACKRARNDLCETTGIPETTIWVVTAVLPHLREQMYGR